MGVITVREISDYFTMGDRKSLQLLRISDIEGIPSWGRLKQIPWADHDEDLGGRISDSWNAFKVGRGFGRSVADHTVDAFNYFFKDEGGIKSYSSLQNYDLEILGLAVLLHEVGMYENGGNTNTVSAENLVKGCNMTHYMIDQLAKYHNALYKIGETADSKLESEVRKVCWSEFGIRRMMLRLLPLLNLAHLYAHNRDLSKKFVRSDADILYSGADLVRMGSQRIHCGRR